MPKERVLSLFHTLAQSQGFYGRLLRYEVGYNGELAPDGFWEQFKNCRSDLDVILAIET